MKILITIFFSVFYLSFFSQSLSLKIDSICIHQIPLSIETNLSFGAYDVRNFDKKYHKLTVLTDKKDLEEFAVIPFQHTSNALSTKVFVDARIVVDIFLETDNIITLAIDNSFHYNLSDNSQVLSNSELKKWLRQYLK
jgi:hypothetical protein